MFSHSNLHRLELLKSRCFQNEHFFIKCCFGNCSILVSQKEPSVCVPIMTNANELSSLASGDDDGAAVCYLCLDGGDDNADQPLRRDCACRGTDAGFVHLSCLTNYAETRSEQTNDMHEFVTPWIFCPSCHQDVKCVRTRINQVFLV